MPLIKSSPDERIRKPKIIQPDTRFLLRRDLEVDGYCMSCEEKERMTRLKAVRKNGRHQIKGRCQYCGKNISKMVSKIFMNQVTRLKND